MRLFLHYKLKCVCIEISLKCTIRTVWLIDCTSSNATINTSSNDISTNTIIDTITNTITNTSSNATINTSTNTSTNIYISTHLYKGEISFIGKL